MSAVTRIEKSNTATLALIDQQNAGVTNVVNIIARSTGVVSNGSAEFTAEGSLVSGIAMLDPLNLAILTEKFLGGGATARGDKKKRGCWGCLEPDCPGWCSNREKEVVCLMGARN